MADLWTLLALPVTTSTEILVGGTVDFYEPGTIGSSNRKDVYTDSAGTSVAANPYTLDANSTATLYGSGLYHIIIKNSSGVTKYDYDYIAPSGAVVYSGGEYNTVADLQAASLTVGSVYRMNGRTAAGDGGGAIYIIETGDTSDGLGRLSVNSGAATAVLLMETVNFKHFGAVGDDVTDDTDSIEACLLSGMKIIDQSGDTYQYTSNIDVTGTAVDLTTNCTFHGVGGGLKFGGALTSIGYLASAATKLDTGITVNTASGLAVGDFIVIHDTVENSFSDQRTYYYAGEHCQVKEISGTSVILESPLLDSYPSGSGTKVYLLDSKDVRINGGTYITEASTNALRLFGAYQPRVTGVDVHSSGVGSSAALNVDKCLGAVIDGGSFYKEYDSVTGTSYGASFINSSDSVLKDAIVFGARHAVASGGDAANGSIPCRNLRVVRCKLYNDEDQDLHCADFHGNTSDSAYIDCEVTGGYGLGGVNNKAIGGVVYEKLGHSKPAFLYTELTKGTLSFEDMRYVCVSGNTSANLLTNESSDQTALIQGQYKLAMKNIEVVDCPDTKTVVMNAYDNSGQVTTWEIDGLDIQGDLTGLLKIVSWTGVAGTSVQPELIRIRNMLQEDLFAVDAVTNSGVVLTCRRDIDEEFRAYSDVTASRDINTTYTNTTGKPILVFANATVTSGGTGTFQVDGTTVASTNTAGTAGYTATVQGGYVPHGSTYRFNLVGTLVLWMEV